MNSRAIRPHRIYGGIVHEQHVRIKYMKGLIELPRQSLRLMEAAVAGVTPAGDARRMKMIWNGLFAVLQERQGYWVGNRKPAIAGNHKQSLDMGRKTLDIDKYKEQIENAFAKG